MKTIEKMATSSILSTEIQLIQLHISTNVQTQPLVNTHLEIFPPEEQVNKKF